MVLACQQGSHYPIIAERVGDRIMTYECLRVKVTAIKSDEGLIIIDTHHCPAIMSEIKKRIEKDLECSTYRYVINTHGHWDHASGNQVFPGSILVGHEKCPRFMQRNPANQLATLWHIQSKLRQLESDTVSTADHDRTIRMWEIVLDDIRNNYRVTPPEVVFADSLTLGAGDITVKIFYCGNAHTNNDIIVYIPELDAVHTGDIINSPSSFSFIMHKLNDIPRIIEVLDRVINDSAGFTCVIPAHGDIMTREDLIGIRELIQEEYEPLISERSAAVLLKTLIRDRGLAGALQEYGETRRRFGRDYYTMEEEFMTLGLQLFWEGDDSAALAVFNVGMQEFPGSALLTYDLANIYLRMGEIDSARNYYERSLEMFSENRSAREILRMLQNE